MPDPAAQQQTGSRDDLCLDRSRCLRVRFNGSDCSHCLEICPAAAISLEQGLELDRERCTGCLLCTSVCPTGALELSADFLACVAQFSKVPEPVLGCCRTKEQANGWLACLGGLSDEHLLYLVRQLTGRLTLNISLCADCPNSSMLPFLQTRLKNLAAGGGCSITAIEKADAVSHREENVDRRSFFKSFRTSLFQTAAVIMNAGIQNTERRSDYTSKRVPERRALVNRTVQQLPTEKGQQIARLFAHQLTFSEHCSTCQGCVAICPTGALTTKDRHQQPVFVPERCTGCGLCVEFCLDQAIKLSPAPN